MKSISARFDSELRVSKAISESSRSRVVSSKACFIIALEVSGYAIGWRLLGPLRAHQIVVHLRFVTLPQRAQIANRLIGPVHAQFRHRPDFPPEYAKTRRMHRPRLAAR